MWYLSPVDQSSLMLIVYSNNNAFCLLMLYRCKIFCIAAAQLHQPAPCMHNHAPHLIMHPAYEVHQIVNYICFNSQSLYNESSIQPFLNEIILQCHQLWYQNNYVQPLLWYMYIQFCWSFVLQSYSCVFLFNLHHIIWMNLHNECLNVVNWKIFLRFPESSY